MKTYWSKTYVWISIGGTVVAKETTEKIDSLGPIIISTWILSDGFSYKEWLRREAERMHKYI